MKPNPLSSLNHLTVPVAIMFPPASIVLRTRRLLSKSYDRWHRDVGRIARPDLATVAALKLSARLTPNAPHALCTREHARRALSPTYPRGARPRPYDARPPSQLSGLSHPRARERSGNRSSGG